MPMQRRLWPKRLMRCSAQTIVSSAPLGQVVMQLVVHTIRLGRLASPPGGQGIQSFLAGGIRRSYLARMADEQLQRLEAHTHCEIGRDWYGQVGLQAARSLASLRGAVGTLHAGTVAVPRAL